MMNYKRISVAIVVCVLVLLILKVPSGLSFTSSQGATVALGQTGFTTSAPATTASGLHGPFPMAFDSAGNFWVGDYYNNRVVEYPKGSGFTTGESAALVMGQTGFGSGAPATTATGLSGPTGAAFDSSDNLWVGEINNNRVVEYLKGGGFATGQAASMVIGQSIFTSAGSATTSTGLYAPEAIAIDSSDNLWVADYGNNRVLEYIKGGGFTTGQAASVVIGQPDFTSAGAATTATGLNGPSGVAFDSSGNLWVADFSGNRVLEYLKGSGFTTGQAASVVIGQADFTSNGAATTATRMSSPIGVTFDLSGNLWVGDIGNNRVLEYLKGSGFTTGQAASVVIGQADFTSNVAGTTATSLSDPQGVIFDPSGNLWVADVVNNRVLGFTGSLQGTTTATATTTAITTSTATTTLVSTTTALTTSAATVTTTEPGTTITTVSSTTSSATTMATTTRVVTSVATTTLTKVSIVSNTGGGGIPEFPFQIGFTLLTAGVLVTSYFFVRRPSVPRR